MCVCVCVYVCVFLCIIQIIKNCEGSRRRVIGAKPVPLHNGHGTIFLSWPSLLPFLYKHPKELDKTTSDNLRAVDLCR